MRVARSRSWGSRAAISVGAAGGASACLSANTLVAGAVAAKRSSDPLGRSRSPVGVACRQRASRPGVYSRTRGDRCASSPSALSREGARRREQPLAARGSSGTTSVCLCPSAGGAQLAAPRPAQRTTLTATLSHPPRTAVSRGRESWGRRLEQSSAERCRRAGDGDW